MRLERFHQSITYWISIVGKILQVCCIVYFRTRMHQVTLTKKDKFSRVLQMKSNEVLSVEAIHICNGENTTFNAINTYTWSWIHFTTFIRLFIFNITECRNARYCKCYLRNNHVCYNTTQYLKEKPYLFSMVRKWKYNLMRYITWSWQNPSIKWNMI